MPCCVPSKFIVKKTYMYIGRFRNVRGILTMRAAAMSVWIFINLLCFGMCGYLYLIWSQYWMHIEKQRLFDKTLPSNSHKSLPALSYQDSYGSHKYNFISMLNNSVALKIDSINKRSAISSFWGGKVVQKSSGNQAHPSSIVVRKSQGIPRFPNIHKPILEFDSEKYTCDELSSAECEARTLEFKEVMLKEFHRVLMGDSKVFTSGLDSHNTYDVKYEGGKMQEASGAEVRCALRGVALRTVTADDQPFKRLGFHIPRDPLHQDRTYNTCAVVTSAGALLGSRLGEFIDSHDMVLRFNNAPTENYTDDVGSKTTFRILNSQVVTKPEYNFLENPLFKNVSILMWDPANYSSTLEEWYQHPDFPLFPVYKKLVDQRNNADVHILKPQVLWDLWSVLQDTSPYRLRKNPPSSGFIGIWFALHRCRRVRAFEYVPSARATRRCHYHADRDDAACTLGAWHPLAQEKALAERMRVNSDLDVFQRGFVDIPGFSDINC